MRARQLLVVALVLVVVVGGVLCMPTARDVVVGRVQGEPSFEGRPLRYWLRTLKTGDEQERDQAAHALGELGTASPEVLEGLSAALNDPSFEVRREAVVALGQLGPAAQAATPAVIAMLKTPEPPLRWRAAQSLGDIQPDPQIAGPVLMAVARDDADYPTRSMAIVALGKLGDATVVAALPVLIDTLKIRPSLASGDPAEAARGVLRKLGPAAIPALTAACKHTDSNARASAAQTLGDMGEPARTTVAAIQPLLNDTAALVRVQAAIALWKLERQATGTVAALAAVLPKADTQMRGDILVGLGAMGDKAGDAVGAIESCLHDSNDVIRRAAVQTLGKIGPPARSAVPSLEKLAKEDESPEVRRHATAALAAISGSRGP